MAAFHRPVAGSFELSARACEPMFLPGCKVSAQLASFRECAAGAGRVQKS